MTSLVLGAASAALCASALLVVMLDAPTRAAGALVLVAAALSGTLSVVDVPFLPGLVLWIGVGAVGLLALATVLLLNLSPDERGQRRIRLTPTLALFLLAYVGAAATGLLVPRLEDLPAASPLGHAEVARAVFEDAALPLAVALAALASAMVGAFVLVRRRP